jgi:hypothetical protein
MEAVEHSTFNPQLIGFPYILLGDVSINCMAGLRETFASKSGGRHSNDPSLEIDLEM